MSLIQMDAMRNKMHSLHNTIMYYQTVTSFSSLSTCKVIKCKLGKGKQILNGMQFSSVRSFSFF